MDETVIYEIGRYDGWEDDAELIDRVQLVVIDSVLVLRDPAGNETPCKGDDVGVVISSTPASREIREGQDARITCAPEIVGRLPFVLEPLIESGDTKNFSARVNGDQWSAFRTEDEDFAMLPEFRLRRQAPDGRSPGLGACQPGWDTFLLRLAEKSKLSAWMADVIAERLAAAVGGGSGLQLPVEPDRAVRSTPEFLPYAIWRELAP